MGPGSDLATRFDSNTLSCQDLNRGSALSLWFYIYWHVMIFLSQRILLLSEHLGDLATNYMI